MFTASSTNHTLPLCAIVNGEGTAQALWYNIIPLFWIDTPGPFDSLKNADQAKYVFKNIRWKVKKSETDWECKQVTVAKSIVENG